ncbi:Hypothetical protein NGAL_HAMBI2605_65480 [Neorhizobium galegae bv. orientalis]|nr:Hypothetical protein NGAL_HAMBI2605_65480 [Neorhizobium galegae bv. orientalis]
MRDILVVATEYAIITIDMLALLVIFVGTLEATYAIARLVVSSVDERRRQEIWLRYGRWLVAGLTFQLAADIVETSITEDWMSIGRIAAIAMVRTFLNYFLERDLGEVRTRQQERTGF